MNACFTHFSSVSTTLFSSGAMSRLLQSGRCFAALVNCRFMHHGRRFHCATPATVCVFLSGLPQAKHAYRRGVASSEQLPSREPYRLFDEKPIAPEFSSSSSSSSSSGGRPSPPTSVTPTPISHTTLFFDSGWMRALTCPTYRTRRTSTTRYASAACSAPSNAAALRQAQSSSGK